VASGPNSEVSKKGPAPAPPLVPLLIFRRFMAQCACVRMRRGRGRLRARRNAGE